MTDAANSNKNFQLEDTKVAPVVPPTPSPYDSFTLVKVSKGFDTGCTNAENQVKTALAALQADPTDPSLLAAYQAALQTASLYRSAQSNAVNALKTLDSGIIQNFR